MAHSVTFNSTFGIIETVIQGDLCLPEAEAIITEIADLAAQERCCLCLSDLREAKFDMSVLQIYNLPRTLARVALSRGLVPSDIKRAFVVTFENRDFHFYETVAINIGQRVRLFVEMETGSG